jgi:hypothetical protein
MHGNSGGRQLERLSGPNKEFECWKERGEVPMLLGQVFAAPPGLHGIDTNTVLDDRHCRAAKARGFSFCLRYVSRGERKRLTIFMKPSANHTPGRACFDVRSACRAPRLVPDKEPGNHVMDETQPRMSVRLGFHRE